MKKTFLLFFILALFSYPQITKANESIDAKITNYMASVSGGMEIVNNYTGDKVGGAASTIGDFWNILEKITIENFEKVSGGFEYLIQDILNAQARGINKIKNGTINYSKEFVSNISGNVGIIKNGVSSMVASAHDGVQNNLNLITLRGDSDNFIPANNGNLPILKESFKNVFNYSIFWAKGN